MVNRYGWNPSLSEQVANRPSFLGAAEVGGGRREQRWPFQPGVTDVR